MFLVKDTIKGRHKKICSFLDTSPAIAILLAAADFEWCINRFIIGLGNVPNRDIRDEILSRSNKQGRRSYVSGLNAYKNAWEKVRGELEPIDRIIGFDRWLALNSAFEKRHALIHGREGTSSRGFAKNVVDTILLCSSQLNDFATDKSVPLYGKRIIVKRKVKITSC